MKNRSNMVGIFSEMLGSMGGVFKAITDFGKSKNHTSGRREDRNALSGERQIERGPLVSRNQKFHAQLEKAIGAFLSNPNKKVFTRRGSGHGAYVNGNTRKNVRAEARKFARRQAA